QSQGGYQAQPQCAQPQPGGYTPPAGSYPRPGAPTQGSRPDYGAPAGWSAPGWPPREEPPPPAGAPGHGGWTQSQPRTQGFQPAGEQAEEVGGSEGAGPKSPGRPGQCGPGWDDDRHDWDRPNGRNRPAD